MFLGQMCCRTCHPDFRWKQCYPKGCAAPGQVQCQCNTRGSLSKLKRTPPQAKINVTSKSPVGDISVVTLIRTDTTLDHSQKAEKVWHGSSVASGAIPRKGKTGESRHDPQGQWHRFSQKFVICCWAEAPIKIARMTLTIKLDGNWSSFQLANSAPPLSVTDSAIAPSARMVVEIREELLAPRPKVGW
jgi:hypothetical protein